MANHFFRLAGLIFVLCCSETLKVQCEMLFQQICDLEKRERGKSWILKDFVDNWRATYGIWVNVKKLKVRGWRLFVLILHKSDLKKLKVSLLNSSQGSFKVISEATSFLGLQKLMMVTFLK